MARPYSARPAYRTVHGRLQRLYGKASSHSCVDCGSQARQWSYETTKTDAEAAAIVAEYLAGGISQTALARKHGVSQPTISEWVRGVKRGASL